MKTRIVVAVIFVPIIFVILFFLPPVFTAVMIALITTLASFELLHGVHSKDENWMPILSALSACAISLGVYFGERETVFFAALFLLVAIMFATAIKAFGTAREFKTLDIMTVIFSGAVIPYFLSVLISLKMMDNGELLVLLPFVCTFASDSGAYFMGVFFGKHKAFPTVSPKKTYEGCVGGIISSVLGMLIYGVLLERFAGLPVNYIILVVYGLAGNIAAQLGDLAFSLIKREHNIKDYSNLIPGHGGMLDRFDSLIFTSPVIYMLVRLIPAY